MKKSLSAIIALMLMLAVFAACGTTPPASSVLSQGDSSSIAVSVPAAERTSFNIAGLKGPTTMGMVKLMADAEAGETRHDYNVEMFGTADEVLGKLINGELDAAAIPANVASVLYNKTEGEIQVAAINTLGVLYVVQTGSDVATVADLKGKTIYSTGKGTTPEYVLNYILLQNGIDPETDVTIEFKSEATEVAAMLAQSENAIAVLPQPYVSAVQMQNEKVTIALNLTEEWDKISEDSTLVTGVLVARADFIAENELAFAEFMQDYAASVDFVNTDTAKAAELVAKFGIVEKAPVAEKALPMCNITFIAGAEMQQKLSGYLTVLFAQNPQSVGGALPKEDFYYGA